MFDGFAEEVIVVLCKHFPCVESDKSAVFLGIGGIPFAFVKCVEKMMFGEGWCSEILEASGGYVLCDDIADASDSAGGDALLDRSPSLEKFPIQDHGLGVFLEIGKVDRFFGTIPTRDE